MISKNSIIIDFLKLKFNYQDFLFFQLHYLLNLKLQFIRCSLNSQFY